MSSLRISRSLFRNLAHHPSSLFLFVPCYLSITLTPPINLGSFSDSSRSSSASAVVLRFAFIGFGVRQLHLTGFQLYLHCFCLECWSLLANFNRRRPLVALLSLHDFESRISMCVQQVTHTAGTILPMAMYTSVSHSSQIGSYFCNLD